MPYGYRRKRRYKRRYVRRKKRFTVRKTARRVRALERRIESKTFMRTHNDPSLGTAPVRFIANNIVQGTDVQQRTGKKIFIKGIGLKYTLNSRDEVASPGFVRFAIVMVKHSITGAYPTFSQVFDPLDSNGTPVTNSNQYVFDEQTRNCKVLWQKTIHMGTRGANESVAPLSATGSTYRKVMREAVYDDTNNCQKTQLMVFVYNAFGGELPVVDFTTKVWFTDS